MGDISSVEWLYNPYTQRQGSSWNCFFGCERFSEACLNCYIPRQPPLRQRHLTFDKAGIGGRTRFSDEDLTHPGKTTIVFAPEKTIYKPLSWTIPRMVFVESLGDLWHGQIGIPFIAKMYAVMLLAPQHVFLTLTKRTQRMRNWLRDPRFARCVADAITEIVLNGPVRVKSDRVNAAFDRCRLGRPINLPPNIWTGTTVENNRRAAELIPVLLDTNVGDGLRWMSCEPLTDEATDPLRLDPAVLLPKPSWGEEYPEPSSPAAIMVQDLIAPGRIDWVVFGGESGPAAKAMPLDTEPAAGLRPLSLENLGRLIGQVHQAGAKVFVKQLGEPWARQSGLTGDKAGRDMQNWPANLRVREYPLHLAEHTLRFEPDNALARQAAQR